MEAKVTPPVSAFLPAAIILMLIGWGGLYLLISYAPIHGGTRWLFYFLSVLALTGTALPLVAFLNRRFPSTPPPSGGVILRQAIWLGIYFPIIAWLLEKDIFSPFLAVLLALGFAAIEFLLRLRERSQWKP